MSERFRPHPLRSGSRRCAARVCVVFALVLGGCGSAAHSNSTSRPPADTTHPLAATTQPPASTSPRTTTGRRGTSPASSVPVVHPACPAGQARTATALCYDPAAQTRLVQKLGPCPAGQVVADNGACQPLTSKGPANVPPLPARCRRLNRAACIPRGSIQGPQPVTRGPGFDPVFH